MEQTGRKESKEQMSQESELKSSFWKTFYHEWGEPAVIAFLVVFFIIRPFFLQAFKIPTGSMIPTLKVGDRLLVDKWTYGARVPFTKAARLPGIGRLERGDIVVFKYPENPKQDYIKRLIAFGGETVEIKNGDVYINGQREMQQDIVQVYYYNSGPFGTAGSPITVPEGYFFVLGDNSASSADSRFWGFVPEQNVIGKADLIYWPLPRIRLLI